MVPRDQIPKEMENRSIIGVTYSSALMLAEKGDDERKPLDQDAVWKAIKSLREARQSYAKIQGDHIKFSLFAEWRLLLERLPWKNQESSEDQIAAEAGLQAILELVMNSPHPNHPFLAQLGTSASKKHSAHSIALKSYTLALQILTRQSEFGDYRAAGDLFMRILNLCSDHEQHLAWLDQAKTIASDNKIVGQFPNECITYLAGFSWNQGLLQIFFFLRAMVF